MTQNAFRPLSLVACACLALAVAGCGSKPRVHVERTTPPPLPGYRTFSILPMTEHTSTSEAAITTAAAPTVIGVIRAQLESKGYEEGKAGQADFVVHVAAGFLPQTDVEALGYPSARVAGIESSDSTLVVIQALDAKNKQEIWSAQTTVEYRKKKKKKAKLVPVPERVERGCRVIMKMLEGFPRAATL